MRKAHALDVVDSMTIRADGGEIEEALVVETPPVDALTVFMVGQFGVDVIFHDDIHVLVATGAREGDVAAVDHGLRVGAGLDVVAAVTVPAAGNFRDVTFEVSAPVDAVGIGGRGAAGPRVRGLLMARSRAGRGRNIFLGLVGQCSLAFFDPLMAIRASELPVGRALKRDLVMAFPARRRDSLPRVPERSGEREPRRDSRGRE
jgi:hypothetical protein